MAGKWYAVATGRQTGIFKTWTECQKQVKGYSGASFKSFQTESEALQFLRQHGGSHRQVRSQRRPSRGVLRSSPPRKAQKRGAGSTVRTQKQISASPASVEQQCVAAAPALEAKPPSADTDPSCTYILRFDGGSRGNPGPAGAGAALWGPGGDLIWRGWFWVGSHCTNNVAEATGLLRGLHQAKALGIARLKVEGDSDLLIKQLNGVYKVRNPALIEFHTLFRELTCELASVSFTHIYRNDNKVADKLANRAMDTKRDGEEYVGPALPSDEEEEDEDDQTLSSGYGSG